MVHPYLHYVALGKADYNHFAIFVVLIQNYQCTVEPLNNKLAFKGSPSIKVNLLRTKIVVSNVISPLFKGYPEIKVKNPQSQWDR